MYFKNFPIIPYKFGENVNPTAFPNLSTFSSVFNQVKDNSTFYNFYQVSDGDRPDIVSRKLYGTDEYYWTFYLLNDAVREHGWSLSAAELEAKVSEDYPGVCLVVFDVATGEDTGFQQHTLVNKFPIGSQVTGLISGATGTVYGRNINLGQLFVDVASGTFSAGETIVDNSSGSPLYACNVGLIHSPAYLAPHHFEDGDGYHVDVDYSADFRGRGPEGDDEPGGVFDNPDFPDPYATAGPYTTVTIYDFYDAKNQSAANIKVLKAAHLQDFIRLYKRSIGAL